MITRSMRLAATTDVTGGAGTRCGQIRWGHCQANERSVAAHWRRKLEVLRSMEADCASECSLFLYRKRLIEAELHQEYVADGMVRRYLYRCDRRRSAVDERMAEYGLSSSI